MLIKGSIHLGIEKFCEIGLKKKTTRADLFLNFYKSRNKKTNNGTTQFHSNSKQKRKTPAKIEIILCKDVLLGFFDFEFDLFESQHVEPHTSAA